ncbi:MAG: RMD1 family protein [Thermoproteales archaeon]|nr:RMD1 family protein [Thermoproteales archaeon]
MLIHDLWYRIENVKYYNVFAYNIGREINIRGIANRLLHKKIRIPWEEPLIIRHHDKSIYIYSFGSIVIVNPYKGLFNEVLEKIKDFIIEPLTVSIERYRIVIIENDKELNHIFNEYGLIEENYLKKNIIVTDDACFLYKVSLTRDIIKIIGFTLAQSLALERIEKDIENALERIRGILERFAKRSFLMRLKPAIKELVQVLEVRFQALSDIMILQKPELTWEDPLLDELYEELRKVYEIDDRFKAVDTMLENILETGQIISDLASTSREMFLEILILLLIAFELILAFIEFLF